MCQEVFMIAVYIKGYAIGDREESFGAKTAEL